MFIPGFLISLAVLSVSVSVSGGKMFLIGITFNDRSEVPETGSTLGLLFLSLIDLSFAFRDE